AASSGGSSKEAALPSPPPLRTVREGLPSSGFEFDDAEHPDAGVPDVHGRHGRACRASSHPSRSLGSPMRNTSPGLRGCSRTRWLPTKVPPELPRSVSAATPPWSTTWQCSMATEGVLEAGVGAPVAAEQKRLPPGQDEDPAGDDARLPNHEPPL